MLLVTRRSSPSSALAEEEEKSFVQISVRHLRAALRRSSRVRCCDGEVEEVEIRSDSGNCIKSSGEKFVTE